MRGGPREGAGRPRGSTSQKSRDKALEIIDSGLTPLDYMMSLMRDEGQPQSVRFEAAKSAAPFVHAKLASVEADIKGKVGVTVEIVRFADVPG